MSRYPLHELNDEEFEDLVTRVCRKILGPGTTSFEKGRDGGKDAKFVGTANCFPSVSGPLSGNVIIQAKHTTDPTKSCSDNDFETNKTSILEKELPKLKRQVDEESATHYLLFTNRKKTGGAESRIPAKIILKTGVSQAWLFGKKDIQDFLLDYPEIAIDVGLNKLRSPINFTPDDIREVVSEFYEQRDLVGQAFDSQHDLSYYPGIETKNEINRLSVRYFEYIRTDSLPRFSQIELFLKNPRNKDFRDKYHAVADELKSQLIVHRDSFENFDEALEHVYQLIHERSPDLRVASHRRLVKIFVHYMYCDCDIGEKAR
tara:strand:- start:2871 stop:3821 length:951 start_codon:yes stop_codon:yes gene_type:complete